ncbi:MAG: SDR family oxidoreductase [Bradymonadia bacterium]
MARIAVTGGAGFIGSHLATALVERGDQVVILDNFSTGHRANLGHLGDRVQVVEGCLTDTTAVDRALEGATAVLHQAAMPSVPKSIRWPDKSHLNNIVGTLSLLEGARRHAVKRVVYAASSSAYGDQEADQKREDMVPNPLSPYAVQKLTGEYYCQVYNHLYGLETIGLRYFNVFGPRQDPKSAYAAVIAAFVSRMLGGDAPVIHGDGLQSRDFTFIDNVVQANLAALSAPASACGRIYNAACGQRASVQDLVTLLNEILGTTIEPTHIEPRPGDVRDSCADTVAAAEALGYTAQISLKEGLARTVEWHRGLQA